MTFGGGVTEQEPSIYLNFIDQVPRGTQMVSGNFFDEMGICLLITLSSLLCLSF